MRYSQARLKAPALSISSENLNANRSGQPWQLVILSPSLSQAVKLE